jgi:hypothetical protein
MSVGEFSTASGSRQVPARSEVLEPTTIYDASKKPYRFNMCLEFFEPIQKSFELNPRPIE